LLAEVEKYESIFFILITWNFISIIFF